MLFAKWVFRCAGIYGLIVMFPMYFMEKQIGIDYPPAITHPEFFYGFVGIGVAWQVLFILLSRDPVKHRILMIPCFLEKATYAAAIVPLFALGRVAPLGLMFGLLDMTLGILFLISFYLTREKAIAAA